MPLTTPQANFIEHPPEKVNHVIADRNQALSEIYGAGYVPESGFETIGVVAIGTAAKQLVQDGIEFASTAINVWGDAHASIYSASDTHRLEALHRNQDRFEKVGQAISHAAKNPGTIVTHYETKLQQAANAFTVAHKHGDMVGAGKAAGQILADAYTISTLGTGVAKITAKATSSAVKATSSFVKSHDFRSPMTFQYDGSRLNSGVPFDEIKLQSPMVKKMAPAAITDTVNLNVQKLTHIIEDYLGIDFRMIKNADGDVIFINNGNTKKIRFDINDPHGYLPHGHVEVYDYTLKDWIDLTDRHMIYLSDAAKPTFKPKN